MAVNFRLKNCCRIARLTNQNILQPCLAGLQLAVADYHGVPMEGHLRYRGYDLTDIVKNCEKEKRFGFEEVAYLLLFGHLPDKKTLDDW